MKEGKFVMLNSFSETKEFEKTKNLDLLHTLMIFIIYQTLLRNVKNFIN